ncbi:hypothetical protein ACWD4B_12320 [Streptomyces sp. NPDC002536]
MSVDDEIDRLLPQGRLRAVPGARTALRDLGEFLLEAYQNTNRPDAAEPLPWMLICAAETTPDDAWQLADAMAKATADEDPQSCTALGTPVSLQRLTDDIFEQFLTALRTAEQPSAPAEGAWTHVPEAPVPSAVSATPTPALSRPPTDADDPATSLPQQTSPFLALTAAAGATHSIQVVPPPNAPDGDGTAEAEHATEGEHPEEPESNEQLLPSFLTDPANSAAPEIRVLGPVSVTGIESSGHGPKLASLAALLYFKPGRSADELCEAMDPAAPWSKNTLQVRISELRKRLGTDADGNPYLPRERNTGYRLSTSVRCDWDQFKELAESGLRKLPQAGIADLDAARRAIATGLDADDTAELLYQDWITVEHQAGNRAGVLHAVEALQAVNRRLDVDMLPQTEELITSILQGAKQTTGL